MNVRDHAVHWSLTAVLSAAVAACGGGGGGEGGAPPVQTAPTLALTTANRDIVSHDAVAGAMSLASTTSLPLGGARRSPAASRRETPPFPARRRGRHGC
jgi:hypothetical protein